MHQMFKLTSYRSLERLFCDIKLYNRFCIVCDEFLSLPFPALQTQLDMRQMIDQFFWLMFSSAVLVVSQSFRNYFSWQKEAFFWMDLLIRKEIFKAFVEWLLLGNWKSLWLVTPGSHLALHPHVFSLHVITRSGMCNCLIVICTPYQKLHHFDFAWMLCGKHFADRVSWPLKDYINFFLYFCIKSDYYFF